MDSDTSTPASVTFGVFLGFGPLIGLVCFFFLTMDEVGPVHLLAVFLSYPVGAIPAFLAALVFTGLTKATELLSGRRVTFSLLAALYGAFSGSVSTYFPLLLVSPAAHRELPFGAIATGLVAGTLCGYFSSLKQQALLDEQAKT